MSSRVLHFRIASAAALLAAIVSTAAIPPAAHAAETEIGNTQKKLSELVDEINSLGDEITAAGKQRARWELDLKEKDSEVATVARQVEDAGRQLADTTSAISDIEAEQQVLDARRREQARHIGEHLAASYRMAGEDFVKLLLNQQSPDKLNRLMRYHRYFTEARMDVVDEYQRTLDAMADNRFRLETQREDAVRKKAALSEEQRSLTREREQRKVLIAELNEEVEDKEAQLRRLTADRERLEKLLAELRRRATELDGDAFVARRGALPWPITGRLVNAFGQPRADGRLAWTGVVIAAEEGDPVKAVFRGRVVFANWLRGFGLLTIVDHGGGYMSLYGHADILLKTEGEWVEGGETIARAGNSGGRAITGLYFEVRHKGSARDPIGWLAKR